MFCSIFCFSILKCSVSLGVIARIESWLSTQLQCVSQGHFLYILLDKRCDACAILNWWYTASLLDRLGAGRSIVEPCHCLAEGLDVLNIQRLLPCRLMTTLLFFALQVLEVFGVGNARHGLLARRRWAQVMITIVDRGAIEVTRSTNLLEVSEGMCIQAHLYGIPL